MIIKIESANGVWVCTNKLMIGHSTIARCEADLYTYDIIICKSPEELENTISKWGYTPETQSIMNVGGTIGKESYEHGHMTLYPPMLFPIII